MVGETRWRIHNAIPNYSVFPVILIALFFIAGWGADLLRKNTVPHEKDWLIIVEEVHCAKRDLHGYEPYTYRAGGETGHEDVAFVVDATLMTVDTMQCYVYSEDDTCKVGLAEGRLSSWVHVKDNWYYAVISY